MLTEWSSVSVQLLQKWKRKTMEYCLNVYRLQVKLSELFDFMFLIIMQVAIKTWYHLVLHHGFYFVNDTKFATKQLNFCMLNSFNKILSMSVMVLFRELASTEEELTMHCKKKSLWLEISRIIRRKSDAHTLCIIH